MIDAMIPGPCPLAYQPSDRPRKPARSAPTIPRMIVMMIPPPSRPGMNSFASAPTINPMMMVQRMFMTAPCASLGSTLEPAAFRASPGNAPSEEGHSPLEMLSHDSRLEIEQGSNRTGGNAVGRAPTDSPERHAIAALRRFWERLQGRPEIGSEVA